MTILRKQLKGIGGQAEAGFTLLEVLVALAVLSLSLAVLLAIFTQGLDRTREDETRMGARVLAQSLLLRAETTPPSSLNPASGMAAPYRWNILLTPYGNDEDRQAWALSPMNIAVEVSWQDHGRDRTISLSTLRLLPKAPSS